MQTLRTMAQIFHEISFSTRVSSVFFLCLYIFFLIRNSWLSIFRGKQDGRCTYYHWQYHTSLSLPLLNMVQWSDIFAIVFLVRTALCKLCFRCYVFNLVKVLEKLKSWVIIRGACNERTQYFCMIDNGCLLSLCQNETIYVNMCSLYRFIFMQIKQIFIWKVLSEDTFSNLRHKAG